jgi:F-type H+-transporting ATPase subunit gamma
MHSLRDVRRRIRSIGTTAQITRAMQMVAASKMRKAQQSALAIRPLAHLLYRIQRHALAAADDFTHPLLEKREVQKRAVILVGTDRGLCGSLNTNLFRTAGTFARESTLFIAVGKRAAQFAARTGRKLAAEFTFTDSPRYPEARPIAAFAQELFLQGQVDQVQIVLTHFVNTLTQEAVVLDFLPIGEISELRIPGSQSETDLAGSSDAVMFEPSPGAVLSYLMSHYLNIYMHAVLVEARASEQSARMVAMTAATDNASALIKDLTLEYNKVRQGNITQELLELSSGQGINR